MGKAGHDNFAQMAKKLVWHLRIMANWSAPVTLSQGTEKTENKM